MGDMVPFLEEDGNVFGLFRPSQAALSEKAGDKLQSLLRRRTRGSWGSSGELTNFMPLIDLKLLVADVGRSREFYQAILGLRTLRVTNDQLVFDLGSFTLTIQTEPIKGLVQFLSKRARFEEDLVVFHVNDILAAVQGLVDSGVEFPQGIERSDTGELASFRDPDGHRMAIWQPSGIPTHIDFYPVLDRILTEEV
jgi:predicted enzyme related to lactoylglutathione lyase